MPMTASTPAAADSKRPRNKYPFYAFRVWQGMPASAWLRTLTRNHCAVSPSRILLALRLSVYCGFNSLLSGLQSLVYGRRIEASPLDRPPLFIIGHWRTGTTLLHELIGLGEGFTAPTSLECFAPAHFLITGPVLRFFPFLLPDKRPMDDVALDWDSPQEDEFALLNLGLGTPYETLLFPNRRPLGQDYLTLTGLAPDQVEVWKCGLLRFLKSIDFRSRRELPPSMPVPRIVLKSPPHTGRLHVLQDMFPKAQFIHIARHPYELFSSTVLLWRALYETQGLQKPQFGALASGAPSIEDYVFDTMDALYRGFFEHAKQIPQQQFCHVRYEDLIRAPAVEIERLYRQLDLGDFTAFRPKLELHLRKFQAFRPNEHRIPEAQKAEIRRRWGWYMERFGYQAD